MPKIANFCAYCGAPARWHIARAGHGRLVCGRHIHQAAMNIGPNGILELTVIVVKEDTHGK